MQIPRNKIACRFQGTLQMGQKVTLSVEKNPFSAKNQTL